MSIPQDLYDRLSHAFTAAEQLPVARAEATAKAQEITALKLTIEQQAAEIALLKEDRQPEPEPVPTDEGWTDFPLAADAKVFHVSSSTGDDANDGSEANPLRSLKAGYDKLLDGRGDHLKLKCGDVWAENFPHGWRKGGRSAEHRLLVSCYGTDTKLPVVRGLVSEGKTVKHLWFVGIRFEDERRNPDSPAFDGAVARLPTMCVKWNNAGEDIGFEGNQFFWGAKGLDVAPGGDYWRERPHIHAARLDGLVIRRNVFGYTYNMGDGHSQGVFAHTGGADVVVHGNVFHQCGWSDHPRLVAFKDSTGKALTRSTVHSHGVYLDEKCGPGSDVSGNILSRCASHGIQQRPGGTCRNNLVLDCAIGWLGAADEALLEDFVCLRGRDIEGHDDPHRGFGVWVDKCRKFTARRVIIAHKRAGIGKYGQALRFEYISTGGFNAGTTRPVPENPAIVCEDVIVHDWNGKSEIKLRSGSFTWKNGVFNDGGSPLVFETIGGFGAVAKTFKGNRYSTGAAMPFKLDGAAKDFAGWKAATGDDGVWGPTRFVDPDRDEGDYNASLGGAGTTEAFIAECLKQSRKNWREAYTAPKVIEYVREGFGR